MAPFSSLWKKAASAGALLIALWLIRDVSFNVFIALQQHEPSQRIFRALLQVNLTLWAVAWSIRVWSRIVPQQIIAELLFQPALAAEGRGTSIYHPVASAADDDIVLDNTQSSSFEVVDEDGDEGETLDAHYESDGEVEEPTKITAPTPAAVANAALDMLNAILIALFLFTLFASGYSSDWHLVSSIAAPTFALLLFVYMGVIVVLPWSKRSEFWIILSLTMTAPWHPVTFRDGFIGDILTSSVRPLQDIAFTCFYMLAGLRGWWSQDYQTSFIDQADASVPAMEKSWLLHTVVLPMCMASPLWYRFLQNLRQTFDYKKRWPYLGNAFKYFCAASVGMVGVFHPQLQTTFGWLLSFVLATLYQVWWDVFMDWGLLVRRNGLWQLRERRLYPNKSLYIGICALNVILRFGWTLTFVPPRYLSPTGVLKENFPGDLSFYLGPLLASAEIVRRTLWGWLRFEWEATKHLPEPSSGAEFKDEPQEIEMAPMKMIGGDNDATIRPFSAKLSDMSSMNEVQILGELTIWATAFCLVGVVAAAHRGTL